MRTFSSRTLNSLTPEIIDTMSASHLRVLIVEKDQDVRQQISDALSQEGFFCDAVENGIQADDILELKKFDVVICDLRIRSGKGQSLCLDLLGRETQSHSIVTTEQVEPKIVDALKTRGAADVCIKPLDYPDFATKIKARVTGNDVNNDPPAQTPDAEPEPETTQQPDESPPMETSANPAAETGVGGDQTKRIVTILLKDPERSRELKEILSAHDMESVTATSSEHLYQVLNQQRVDMVVVENELDGFLSGIEILARLYDDLIRPEAILLAVKNDRIEKKAKDIGLKTVMDPETDFNAIADAINGLCANASDRNEIISPRARKMIQEFEGIPPLPHLVIKLMNYMTMEVEDIPIKELGNDISFDPKAITELLKITNSSSMGLGRKVTNVTDAVALLGPKRTISLIFASSALATQSKLLKGWSEPLRKWFHQRSILIASTASVFAQKLEKVSPDTAFILGLLQELGILVLAKKFGDQYTKSVQQTLDIAHMQLHLIEEKEYKLTHAEITAALLQKWKFPQSLIGPVLDHHNPGRTAERSNVELSFLNSMRIGEAVANLTDIPHPVRCQIMNQLLDAYGEENGALCRECIKKSVDKTAESCKLFSLPVPDDDTMEKLINTVSQKNFAEDPALQGAS